jgi:serine protease inhibitor/2-polyprenyl-3-methyl-5-hydroxy-6-metoxy-1,4-benzoquinol methylase
MAATTLATHASSIRSLAARWLPALAADPEVRRAGGDFACSPAGLWLALASVAAGAEGETAAELRALLGTAGPEAAREVTDAARALAATDALAVATGVWSRTPVRDAYRTGLPDVGFGPLGDPARIDAWVREATGGLIGKLPAEVTEETRLLLVNALALKARWAKPFHAADTGLRDFRDAGGAVHQVQTMHRGIRLADAWGTAEGVTVVELPCRPAPDGVPGARVRLVLGEPGAPAAEVLPAAWSRTRVKLDCDEVRIALPRLALRTTSEVTGHFAALGLRLAPTAAADFSLLSAEPVYVGRVRQECVLKVAELGVEAAAVTAVMMPTSAMIVRRPLRIAFDRPFGIVVLPADGDAPLFAAWQATAPREPEPPAYELDEGDPAEVWRTTFVPFLPDGRCLAVVQADGSVRLPSGDVRRGEVWLRDTALRVPLEFAGFRIQRVRPFAYEAAGRHVFARVEGDRYEGRRPHASAPWRTGSPQEVASALTDPRERAAVLDADRSRRAETDETYFADSVRQTELTYLRGGSRPEIGSGFGAGPEQWRIQRRMVVAGLHKDGTFLDVGCANGLLMESVVDWAAQDGRHVEPYGVDLAPGLVAEARRRLPAWADRIEAGNALDWVPSGGRRFDFVHVLADVVPPARFPDVVRHALARLVAPGGRLLVSVYQPEGGTAPDAAERLTAVGLRVEGSASGSGAPRTATTAWAQA